MRVADTISPVKLCGFLSSIELCVDDPNFPAIHATALILWAASDRVEAEDVFMNQRT